MKRDPYLFCKLFLPLFAVLFLGTAASAFAQTTITEAVINGVQHLRIDPMDALKNDPCYLRIREYLGSEIESHYELVNNFSQEEARKLLRKAKADLAQFDTRVLSEEMTRLQGQTDSKKEPAYPTRCLAYVVDTDLNTLTRDVLDVALELEGLIQGKLVGDASSSISGIYSQSELDLWMISYVRYYGQKVIEECFTGDVYLKQRSVTMVGRWLKQYSLPPLAIPGLLDAYVAPYLNGSCPEKEKKDEVVRTTSNTPR